MFLPTLLSSLLALPIVLGVALNPRDTACVHSAADRSCWSDGFDISTNYYEEVPDTGVVREYWINIANITAAPDGVEMPVQLISGSFPGPAIIADWGDAFVVHVTNPLQNNGTGLHFHGIRQNWTE